MGVWNKINEGHGGFFVVQKPKAKRCSLTHENLSAVQEILVKPCAPDYGGQTG